MISEYINRRDVQNILSKYYPDAGPTTEQILHNINRDVKNVPDADVIEARHGRWKPWDLTFGRSVYACSVCGEGEDVPTVMGEPMFSYCPHCGAKMDGERE